MPQLPVLYTLDLLVFMIDLIIETDDEMIIIVD